MSRRSKKKTAGGHFVAVRVPRRPTSPSPRLAASAPLSPARRSGPTSAGGAGGPRRRLALRRSGVCEGVDDMFMMDDDSIATIDLIMSHHQGGGFDDGDDDDAFRLVMNVSQKPCTSCT